MLLSVCFQNCYFVFCFQKWLGVEFFLFSCLEFIHFLESAGFSLLSNLKSFQVVFFEYFFSFTVSSLSRTLVTWMFDLLLQSSRLLRLCFFIYFPTVFSLCCTDWVIPIILVSSSPTLLLLLSLFISLFLLCKSTFSVIYIVTLDLFWLVLHCVYFSTIYF